MEKDDCFGNYIITAEEVRKTAGGCTVVTKDAATKSDTKSQEKNNTKERLLSMLTHEPTSKAELIEALNISDRNVRKTIEELRKDGYPICSSASKKGYWLANDNEDLRACISEYYSRSARLRLTAVIMERNLEIFKEQYKMEGC